MTQETKRNILAELRDTSAIPVVDEEFMQIFLSSSYEKRLMILDGIHTYWGDKTVLGIESEYDGVDLRRLKCLYDYYMGIYGPEWVWDQIHTFEKNEQKEKNVEC